MTFIREQAKPNKGQDIVVTKAQSRILNTLHNQNSKGFEKYGEYLSTFNGRDSIRDMWEEIADLINYAEALTEEYERMKDMLFSLYFDVDDAREYMDENFTEQELKFLKSIQ